MAGWKQKRKHMRDYSRTAVLYNIRYGEEQALKISVVIDNIEHIERSSILDLGCGTGLLLPRIQEAKEVVGIDLSKSMLKEVKFSLKQSPNIHLVQGDADHIPLRDDYFDTVFAITLLQNMPRPSRTLQEIKRVAKTNTSIVVTGLKKQFTEHSFLKLLENANLKPKLLETNESVKCHIAFCKNRN